MDDFDLGPAGNMARAVRVLVAADFEPAVEFLRQPIFAHVEGAADRHIGAETNVARAGDRIGASADVGAGGGDTRRVVGLSGHRIVTGHISVDVVEPYRRYKTCALRGNPTTHNK